MVMLLAPFITQVAQLTMAITHQENVNAWKIGI